MTPVPTPRIESISFAVAFVKPQDMHSHSPDCRGVCNPVVPLETVQQIIAAGVDIERELTQRDDRIRVLTEALERIGGGAGMHGFSCASLYGMTPSGRPSHDCNCLQGIARAALDHTRKQTESDDSCIRNGRAALSDIGAGKDL